VHRRPACEPRCGHAAACQVFCFRRKHAALGAAGTPAGGAGAPEPLALPRALPTGAAAPGAPGALAGLRLGVFRAWFEDADAEVVAACRRAVALLVDRGAQARPPMAVRAAPGRLRQLLGAARRCGARRSRRQPGVLADPRLVFDETLFACKRVCLAWPSHTCHTRLLALRPRSSVPTLAGTALGVACARAQALELPVLKLRQGPAQGITPGFTPRVRRWWS